MKVRRLKNEEQKSKEETEKKKPDLRFCVACDELGLFLRKPEQGGKCIGNEKRKKKKRTRHQFCVLQLFFFFEFRLESAVSPESTWISLIQRESARVCTALARVVKWKKKKKNLDLASTHRQWRPSRVAASDASAMGVLPHPCILASRLIDSCKNLVHNLKSIIWSSLVGKIRQIIIMIIINKLLNSPKAKIIIIIT